MPNGANRSFAMAAFFFALVEFIFLILIVIVELGFLFAAEGRERDKAAERELQRRRMEKRPGRIKAACFILTVEMIFMFMIPMVLMIIDTLTGVGL